MRSFIMFLTFMAFDIYLSIMTIISTAIRLHKARLAGVRSVYATASLVYINEINQRGNNKPMR